VQGLSAVGSLNTEHSYAASVLGTLTVPIYQGGAEYSAIRQAKELLGQTRLNLDVTRDQTRQTVVQSWGLLLAARANIEATTAQVQAAVAAAEAAFTPNVAGHMYKVSAAAGYIHNGVTQGLNADGSAQYNPYADALVGGFGAAVTTASNGVKSIASSNGLQVGLQWARSLVTGTDSVLKSADFQQISLPQIGSALAKTALGVAGMLGPAGSGAEVSTVPIVTMGTTATTPPTVHATIVAQFGTQTIQAISQKVVDVSMDSLAHEIANQRG